MKNEMRGQMVFQNKMRALKQIELSKYGGKEPQQQQQQHSHANEHLNAEHNNIDSSGKSAAAPASMASYHGPNEGLHHRQHQAPAQQNNEAKPNSPSHNNVSDALEQDLFWNPEDDDQIFDFLMEH